MTDHNYEPGDLVWRLGGHYDATFGCAEVVKATAKRIRIKNGTGVFWCRSAVSRDTVYPTKRLAAEAGSDWLNARIESAERALAALRVVRAEADKAMGGDA